MSKIDKKFKSVNDNLLLKDLEIFNNIEFDGTLPSPEDDRDYTSKDVACEVYDFPDEYEAPEVEILNQGSVGSCVAHALASALSLGERTILKRAKYNNFSRGYIYANRKSTDYQGSGMITRQALKQLNKCGDVLYEDFPYNIKYPEILNYITDKDKLDQLALPYAILNYYRCYTEDEIKECIMERGGVIVCVPVYTDFSRDLHITKTNKLRGHHAMIIVGWTKEGKWIVQNSWGKNWGYNGKLLMAKDYPVSEYWGITINTENDIAPIPSKLTRVINCILNLFKVLISKLKGIFKKK